MLHSPKQVRFAWEDSSIEYNVIVVFITAIRSNQMRKRNERHKQRQELCSLTTTEQRIASHLALNYISSAPTKKQRRNIQHSNVQSTLALRNIKAYNNFMKDARQEARNQEARAYKLRKEGK
jgi:hypothetical protein